MSNREFSNGLGWFLAIAGILMLFGLFFYAIPQSIAFEEKCNAAGGGVVRGECVPVIELD